MGVSERETEIGTLLELTCDVSGCDRKESFYKGSMTPGPSPGWKLVSIDAGPDPPTDIDENRALTVCPLHDKDDG